MSPQSQRLLSHRVAARRRWRARVWPILIAGLIVAASHRPKLASPGDIPHLDKMVHFAVYGLLATLVCRNGAGWRAAAGAWLIVAAFGATDEWHQSFVPGRSVELADWLADTLGAALAVCLYAGVERYRRVLERDLWQPRVEKTTTGPKLTGR